MSSPTRTRITALASSQMTSMPVMAKVGGVCTKSWKSLFGGVVQYGIGTQSIGGEP